jgi:hypothetical protein
MNTKSTGCDYNEEIKHCRPVRMECAICLNQVRTTRKTPKTLCGHCYHQGCLAKWKSKGGNTCPLCRKYLVKQCLFKITIERRGELQMTEDDILHSNEDIRRLIESLELDPDQIATIELEINDPEGARRILMDAGIELGDLNPSIFNAE